MKLGIRGYRNPEKSLYSELLAHHRDILIVEL